MRYILAISVLLFSGCDDTQSNDGRVAPYGDTGCPNISYSWPNDVYGSTITLKATGHQVTYIDIPEMEQIYRDVEMCVINNKTPGPTVEFRDFQQLLGEGAGGWGIYVASGNIYINTDERVNGVERNCHSDSQTLKHEYVHYILWTNGLPWKHESPAFKQCDALGPRMCDGVPCKDD